jgi:hypothetical protein
MGQSLTTEEKEMKVQWDELRQKSQFYVNIANDQTVRKRMSIEDNTTKDDVRDRCFQKVIQYDEGSMNFPAWYKHKTGKELNYIKGRRDRK